MQHIGEKLEEARKRKGVSIREAAEATKIRGDYLQKFEANTFDLDLPPLYVRGFVRNYARYLELDAERFVAEFDAALAHVGGAPRRDAREVYGRVEFGGDAGAAAAGGAPRQALPLKYVLYGGGALLLALLLYGLVSLLSSPAPAPARAATAAPAASQPPSASVQLVTFTASAEARLKIVQQPGDQIIAGSITLNAGEARTFRKTGSWIITLSDRTKFRMEINGRLTPIPVFAPDTDPYGQFKLE